MYKRNEVTANVPSFSNKAEDVPVTILQALIEAVWNFCAGWNKKPFGRSQLRHIFESTSDNPSPRCFLEIAPLGEVSAMSVDCNDRQTILISPTIVDPCLIDRSLSDLLDWVASNRGTYCRFLILHEVGHLLMHSEDAPITNHNRLDQDLSYVSLARDHFEINAAHTEEDINATIREIEADLYAVIALVPDNQLTEVWLSVKSHERKAALVEEVKRSLNLNEVAECLPVDTCEVHEEFLHELAEYRVALYMKYCGIFYSLSQHFYSDGFYATSSHSKRLAKDRELSEDVPDELRQEGAMLALYELHPIRKTQIANKLLKLEKPYARYMTRLANNLLQRNFDD